MADLEGVYINGYNGELIQITNLQKALDQAKNAVNFHRNKMICKKVNSKEIIFPKAQKEWEHILLELEKISFKFNEKQV